MVISCETSRKGYEMQVQIDLKGRHLWPAVLLAIVICMLAGAGMTWFVALYTSPKYEQYQKELLADRDGDETEVMKAWNEKQIKKSKRGK